MFNVKLTRAKRQIYMCPDFADIMPSYGNLFDGLCLSTASAVIMPIK